MRPPSSPSSSRPLSSASASSKKQGQDERQVEVRKPQQQPRPTKRAAQNLSRHQSKDSATSDTISLAVLNRVPSSAANEEGSLKPKGLQESGSAAVRRPSRSYNGVDAISQVASLRTATTSKGNEPVSPDTPSVTPRMGPSARSSMELIHHRRGSPVEETTALNRIQGRPDVFSSTTAEIAFVLICSSTQLLFAAMLGDCNILQLIWIKKIHILQSELPWVQGSFMLANGLAVLVSGSLADLTWPKAMIIGSLVWLVVWDIVGGVSLIVESSKLFFIVRAMQGAAIGILVSTAMSMLGRTYQPGRRKNRAFSVMAAFAPTGFFVGCLQGGSLAAHPTWVFWSNAIVCSAMALLSVVYLPNLQPAAASAGSQETLSIRSFDWPGAGLGLAGSGLLLFGLTQGTPSGWQPYTIATTIVGFLLLGAFAYVEGRVARPLVPTVLWRTPGFAWLALSYALGFGMYTAWQWYAVSFFLRTQMVSPIMTALYVMPNAIVGVLATLVVARTTHLVPAHWLLITSMASFAFGPAFFLPQTANTIYWVSFCGIALVTLGPDLSFAAASIFITSQVPRHYQGSAGALLITIQNLSSALLTSVSDAIGATVSGDAGGEGAFTLQGLRAIWWFNLAGALVGAVLCAWKVRIPKSEEKEHVT